MKALLISLCLSLACLLPDASARTLHFILVADTNDPGIGLGCEENLKRLGRVAEDIAKHTDLRVKKYILKGAAFQKAGLQKTLQNLHCEPSDVLWFYYSGHGVNSGEKWPTLRIGTGMRLSQVAQTLKQKGGKFTIVSADCCNYVHGATATAQRRASKDASARGAYSTTAVSTAYRHLFEKPAGELLMSSSQAGEFSVYVEDIGGMFTAALCLDLYELSTTTANLSWDLLLQETKRSTQRNLSAFNRSQTPQYELRTTNPAGLILGAEVDTPTWISYTVQAGDCYWEIGKRHGILETELKNWIKRMQDANKVAKLHPNQKLQLQVPMSNLSGNDW